VIADDLKSLRRVLAGSGPFRPALRAALRRRHISLVENLLILLGKEKGLFALNTGRFNVRHLASPFCDRGDEILSQTDHEV
jgi:hypothetical protein